MKRALFLPYISVILLLAAATFLEKYNGTEYVQEHIYGTIWFTLLWGAVALAIIVRIVQSGMWRRPPSLLLHLSFVLILAGALLTSLTARQGTIHLRQGVCTDIWQDEKNKVTRFPFFVKLDTFRVDYYEGTDSPMDYISEITLYKGAETHAVIVSMNNIASFDGYRFCQASFDEDGKGTLLSVSNDEFGIPVTYAGYTLAILSMLWTLLSPRSTFRKLVRQLASKRYQLLLPLFAVSVIAKAQNTTLPRQEADQLGKLLILSGDRVMPLQTFARDFTAKITGSPTYENYTAEQVFSGWLLAPEQWQYEPMIEVKNEELRRKIGSGKKARFVDFFTPEKHYKLKKYETEMYRSGGLTPFIKAVRQADEKIQLIYMLQAGTLLAIFPDTTSGKLKWYTPVSDHSDIPSSEHRRFMRNAVTLLYESTRQNDTAAISEIIGKIAKYQRAKGGTKLPASAQIRAEHIYNTISIPSWLFKANLFLGILSLALFIVEQIVKTGRHNTVMQSGNTKEMKYTKYITTLLCLSLLLLTIHLLLRTWIGERIPLGNGYETMLFTAWCAMLAGVLLRKRMALSVPFALILSGCAMLVAVIGEMDPRITPLVPVLRSPLLSIHVTLIMAAYTLFGFITLNALAVYAIILLSRAEEHCTLFCRLQKFTLISRILLYPAAFLLASGILIGAVWANISWGRYWAWDPKEVWALITLMIYALAFHLQTLPAMRKPLFFHTCMLFFFATVPMTYFGVNYLLGGMHAYGGNVQITGFLIPVSILLTLQLLLVLFAVRKYKILVNTIKIKNSESREQNIKLV